MGHLSLLIRRPTIKLSRSAPHCGALSAAVPCYVALLVTSFLSEFFHERICDEMAGTRLESLYLSPRASTAPFRSNDMPIAPALSGASARSETAPFLNQPHARRRAIKIQPSGASVINANHPT